jgi:hypothetical protein
MAPSSQKLSTSITYFFFLSVITQQEKLITKLNKNHENIEIKVLTSSGLLE